MTTTSVLAEFLKNQQSDFIRMFWFFFPSNQLKLRMSLHDSTQKVRNIVPKTIIFFSSLVHTALRSCMRLGVELSLFKAILSAHNSSIALAKCSRTVSPERRCQQDGAARANLAFPISAFWKCSKFFSHWSSPCLRPQLRLL